MHDGGVGRGGGEPVIMPHALFVTRHSLSPRLPPMLADFDSLLISPFDRSWQRSIHQGRALACTTHYFGP
eukprot:scaffold257831_cov31-Tisochrysis_lutea.AAC.5